MCWTFSEHKDNYVFTYTCARISLAPAVRLAKRRKRIIPFESKFDERERATLRAPRHTKIFTLLGGPTGEWINARSNTWVRYTRFNAIFQFTLIDPPCRPEAKAAHISRIKRSRFSLLRQIRRGALLNGIFAIRIKRSVNLMENGKNKCATVRYPRVSLIKRKIDAPS